MTVEDMTKIMLKKEEVNVNKRAYDYILELVARNPNRFYPSESGDYQGEVWGKIDGEKVYIIKSVFDREMGYLGFNAAAFLSWAKRVGLSATAKDRRTIVARIGGAVTNCVCILTDVEHQMEEVAEDVPF